jgi:hypothetical protein
MKYNTLDEFYSAHPCFTPSVEHEFYQDYFEEARDFLEENGYQVLSCNEDGINYTTNNK